LEHRCRRHHHASCTAAARLPAPIYTVAFIAKYRDDPNAIAKYLNDAMSTADAAHIKKSIGDMVRAQGMTRFVRKIRVDRPSLYRSFRGAVRPPFETVLNVLLALDLQLNVKPSGGEARAKGEEMTNRQPKGRWSMKDDRRLIELSKLRLPFEAIAARLKQKPDLVLKRAIRLGLSLKSDRGLKAIK
jgi:probable addiction module antidote protein